ncbi:Predicted flavoprotein CzcO associated with the cation diffusion facilitator CzcD [Amycolatopsis pretoriensis]|uniref:Predicted flavoprotein CzcO associated with the cation diffusion facilitator CzcD n=1 Tax=Amycolatopsis pretoriensis TaxID=218821 RepID=A0A1H5QGP6_9PSEU|nr:NAD(P)/FAD-dependent oxidoreductase [Amycolatopsis pretoriensis]SEF25199.1 Predicted flavoprotein CzcO associated with the cation diffusion facilitator CzcD [Amycolatopsis pretoriensis]
MTEHVDVLIVGAGLSGVGAACRLQERLPGKTYAVLEARDTIGGTWDLFRYPGIRSDSDMFTLGYPFRPWKDPKAIADGPSILSYIRSTAASHGIVDRIRFGHRVVRASWSSSSALWTVSTEHGATFTCRFLYLCSGYYSYESGHVVDFPGRAEFAGEIVHPQHWPAALDYTDKRVVVIGSGATAVTLVPALASTAAHVTMLQRSPSYIVARPGRDALADRLRALLPEKLAHRVVRGKNVVMGTLFFQLMRRLPKRASLALRKRVAAQLPASIPVDPHFVPSYDPWDQRLCLVPDADLFRALRSGKADIVTDGISRFTSSGVLLKSGHSLEADIIVTATGLRLVAFGGIALTVDGRAIEPGDQRAYKGMMFGGVPNLAWCVGYTNNSWTLRADLTSQYVCRLLAYLDRRGFAFCMPDAESASTAGRPRPIVDLASGYIKRAAPGLPKQGEKRPWMMRQNYLLDFADMRLGRVDDGVLRFGRAEDRATAAR